MRTATKSLPALLALVLAAPAAAQDGLDDNGYVGRWLLLAPIPLAGGESGADGLDKAQVTDEAKLRPKAGDKVKAGDKEIAWKEHKATDGFFDFNAFLGAQTENSVGYAVTYLVAPEEMKGLQMKTGSDDQCKVFINGKEVFKFTEPRALEKDQDTTEVTLQKGVNVIVFKVVNEGIDWSGSLRFFKGDQPVKNLKAQLTPE
jgi:hypothetical protein